MIKNLSKTILLMQKIILLPKIIHFGEKNSKKLKKAVTWSIWSDPVASDDKIVVSESGEQWSPKHPPPITAAIAAYTTGVKAPPDIFRAIYTQIGVTIA